METITQAVPQNPAAERAILGAVIKNNRCLDDAGLLEETDFFLSQHAKLFRTMRAMSEKGEPIDLVSLTDTLRVTGELADVGGSAYVAKLVDGVAMVSNVSHYAR